MNQDIMLLGNFNSDTAQLVNVELAYCDPTTRSTCKTQAETTEWLKDKFFYIVIN